MTKLSTYDVSNHAIRRAFEAMQAALDGDGSLMGEFVAEYEALVGAREDRIRLEAERYEQAKAEMDRLLGLRTSVSGAKCSPTWRCKRDAKWEVSPEVKPSCTQHFIRRCAVIAAKNIPSTGPYDSTWDIEKRLIHASAGKVR